MLQADSTPRTEERPTLPKSDGLTVATDEWERVRILVIGSSYGVNSIIRTLYVLGFAEISDWSPLLPAPHSGDVMSILTRKIGRERHF
ncbi:hypothetical protein [Lusitaniella coriacea]|uniref:hypothetical protein n=1 Tax=Lusitaniella coriacea TaxID=1983105 RepID=UPI003CEB4245